MALKTFISGFVVQAVADEEMYFAQMRAVEQITAEVRVDDFDCEKFGTSDFDQAGFIKHLEVLAKDAVPELNFKFQQGACQVRYEPYEYKSERRRRRRTRDRYHEQFPPAMEHQNLYCGNVGAVCASSCAIAGGCIGFEVMLQRQHPEYAWCRIFAETNETVEAWKAEEQLPINGAGPWLSVYRARTKEREYPNRASTGIDTADGTTTNFCMGLPSGTPPNPPTPPPTPRPPTPRPTPLPTPTTTPPLKPDIITTPPIKPDIVTTTPTTTDFPINPTPFPINPTPSPIDPTPSPTPCPTCPACTPAPVTPTPAPVPWCERPGTDAGYLLTGSKSIASLEKGTTNGVVRYPNLKVRSNGVETDVDLLFHPLTPWRGKKCNSNNQCTAGGYDAIGGMGMINLEIGRTNSEYEFEFRFVHPGKGKDSEAIPVDDLYVEFFDIDTGNDEVLEKVIVNAKEVSDKPEVGSKVELVDESQEEGSWQWGFVALEYGDSKNNPSSLVHIDDVQISLKAKVRYQNKGSFWTKFAVGRKGSKGGRNFYFSLNECPVE